MFYSNGTIDGIFYLFSYGQYCITYTCIHIKGFNFHLCRYGIDLLRFNIIFLFMYTTIHTNFIVRDADIITSYCYVIIKRDVYICCTLGLDFALVTIYITTLQGLNDDDSRN